ncbi:hypothetical protein [uncultured Jannaschia sp.]|uniref:hypothetical protein n=1 Tax=uncultured Jannaschia sp. TaxID=293347 RepID=UPI0026067DDD|nr:hypothetical protein [uncultured Jannaschia sp.]
MIDTFKSLMQDDEWPVGLILSGMPAFKRLVNADPQLARRMYAIEYSPISSISDHEMIEDVVSSYAAKGALQTGSDLSRKGFIPRLIHAGASQFGLIVQRVYMSIDEAMRNGDTTLGWQHFAWEFRRKTKCIDAFNPFLAEDYLAIKTLRLLRPDKGDPL